MATKKKAEAPKKPAAKRAKPKGSQLTGEAGQAWERGGFVKCAADQSK